ncbi:unnamed protein product [Oikopleura dioica]|uniref:Uncharacterized protein n=1 Tax=Oikopleura dioica TaxID=34765 RepID=E4YAQ6_OIKDI|nr:unnamed protein product [Oikopleura dioica]
MFEQVEADFQVPGGESFIMEMDGPKRGALISPRYESRAPRQCFSFWYKDTFFHFKSFEE